VAAVLLWLPPGRGQTAGLRRLQVHSLQGRRPVFVFRPLAAQAESSPAPLRLVLEASRPTALMLRLLKRRGPAHELPVELPAWPDGLGAVLARRLAVPTPAESAEMSDVSSTLLARPVPRPGLQLVAG
jgi:protein ImuA